MTDIRLRTMTMDARGITTNDTDVVKHGCCLQKLTIKIPLRMMVCYLEYTVSHLSAML